MDCYLPADFFLADDARRLTHGDYELGADAHVHIESPAFVTGLRDWKHEAPSKPRGPYPRRRPVRLTDSEPEWHPL